MAAGTYETVQLAIPGEPGVPASVHELPTVPAAAEKVVTVPVGGLDRCTLASATWAVQLELGVVTAIVQTTAVNVGRFAAVGVVVVFVVVVFVVVVVGFEADPAENGKVAANVPLVPLLSRNVPAMCTFPPETVSVAVPCET